MTFQQNPPIPGRSIVRHAIPKPAVQTACYIPIPHVREAISDKPKRGPDFGKTWSHRSARQSCQARFPLILPLREASMGCCRLVWLFDGFAGTSSGKKARMDNVPLCKLGGGYRCQRGITLKEDVADLIRPCNQVVSEPRTTSPSPAWSHDRPVWPSGCLCVRTIDKVHADGHVRHGRRLHEDDGTARAAWAKTLRGHDAGLHCRDGLCGADYSR